MPVFAEYTNEECTPRIDAAAKAHRGVVQPRAKRWLLILIICVSTCAYAGHPWRVVILPGADPTQPAAQAQIRAIRGALAASAPDGVEFYTDSLDDLRFDGAALMPAFLALMKKKYEHKQVDIVVGLTDFALDFAKRYHEEIWPGAPVLISSVEDKRRKDIPAEFSYAPLHFDVEGTLALVERLQPQARRLVVVSGAAKLDVRLAQSAAAAVSARQSRKWAVEIWSGLTVAELQQRLAKLDLNTAVLYTTMYRDREGRTYFPFEVVAPMAKVSGAPIYGWYPTYLGQGLTAGSVISFETDGRLTGELAASILLGKTPAHGATTSTGPSRCAADVGRLEQLGLRTGALPGDCELRNAPPSLWRENRSAVLITLTVLLLQALTIAALLWQRSRRRVAEDAAALRLGELARAARFAAAGELSASIAHEVGQPLGAILSNADAAGMMLEHDQPEIGELHSILADVRRDALRANQVVQRLRSLLQKQPVEFGRLDLNTTVEEALELLGPEARRRRLTVESNLAANNADIMGDRIQIQQVLLNLSINAMDAMEDTEPSVRVMSISTRSANAGFELSVADRGHGIPPEAKARLFESLYTTKPHGMGLGLSIVRTIVDTHGGEVSAVARSGGGSVFTVWFPPAAEVTTPRTRHKLDKATARPTVEARHTTQGGHP
ncbi:sensor histidine kinase [Paraburkholderia fungorum]|uniref:sensor histidine kinase n=1 Tax=Paraburkholderia fungorum TaxID=134537 RepID=UPI0038B78DDC